MRTGLIILAILVGAAGVMVAITQKPTGFDRCVSIIGRDIDARAAATGATLDPRDVEVEAARICAGDSVGA
jgi:hypothetical protein